MESCRFKGCIWGAGHEGGHQTWAQAAQRLESELLSDIMATFANDGINSKNIGEFLRRKSSIFRKKPPFSRVQQMVNALLLEAEGEEGVTATTAREAADLLKELKADLREWK